MQGDQRNREEEADDRERQGRPCRKNDKGRLGRLTVWEILKRRFSEVKLRPECINFVSAGDNATLSACFVSGKHNKHRINPNPVNTKRISSTRDSFRLGICYVDWTQRADKSLRPMSDLCLTRHLKGTNSDAQRFSCVNKQLQCAGPGLVLTT